jgi:molybdate transport system substrate-binding protein
MFRKRSVLVLGAVAALALAGCSSSSKTGTPSGSSSTAGLTGKITVLAASSLTKTFNQLGTEFQTAHPGTTVSFSYGSSATLATQIVQGAPADVFASASPATMKTVTDASDAVGTPATFVKNQLVIATAPGDPKGIKTLADLTKPGIKVVLCVQTAPCGAAAQTALTAGGVKLTPISFQQDVASTLNAVQLGEADAALVYRTDVKGTGGKVDGQEFPESAQAINNYLIAPLAHSSNAALAAAFVEFIESPPAIAELVAAGFQAP